MIFEAYRPRANSFDGWGRHAVAPEKVLGYVVANTKATATRRARKKWVHDGTWNVVKVRRVPTADVHGKYIDLKVILEAEGVDNL